MVFGQVVTKRTLWLATTAAYGAVVALGPTILGEVGLEAACGGAGGQHAACSYGWTFADDTCFKIFGDGIAEPALEWAAAERACHLMGMDTHLASVTSAEQQRAVTHLASSGASHWIGLNDVDNTGSFVWSDDEPLEYTNWAPGEPSGNNAHVAVTSRSGENMPRGWDDFPDGANPYICGKKATPSECQDTAALLTSAPSKLQN